LSFRVTGFDHVVLNVADAEKSIAFYCEVLGLKAERVDEWLHAVDPEQLVVAVDARGRQVASRGWQTSTDRDVTTFCQVLTTRGVLRVLYTDVERDGMLGGPNVEVTGELASILKVIGSGGVGSVEHLRQLAQAGAEAAIVGTALYEGTISLQEALAC